MSVARIATGELEKVIAAALVRSGTTAAMAQATARALVAAEMDGLASHGASRVRSTGEGLELAWQPVRFNRVRPGESLIAP